MSEMPPSPAAEEPGHNLPVFSVSEISLSLKRTLEDAFGRVRVRGEVSGFKRAASGHLYFALKDESAVLDAVCWRGTAARLGLGPEDGMEVVCSGRITTYPGRSKYQIVVESIELAGEGALLKLLEDRKRRLEAEGLFAPERKKPIPFLPDVIGVVTSPTGAVIRDILHRLGERFPRRVLLWPVLVQGESAAAQIAAAIAGFNDLAPGADQPVPRPDVLIVARGGGSLEDLWAFNEEEVVRAAAASRIPLISAVGHETDTTLIDFAADRRAPTPSAAAEIAVPVRTELLAQTLEDARRMVTAMGRLLDEYRNRVAGLGRGLPDPHALLETAVQRLDDRVERLRNAAATLLARLGARIETAAARLRHPQTRIDEGRARLTAEVRALGAALARRLAEARLRLDNQGGLLESYSYRHVLARGFALVTDRAGGAVSSAALARAAHDVVLRFHDDALAATIAEGPPPKDIPPKEPAPKETSPAGGKDRAGAKRARGDTRQGKLL